METLTNTPDFVELRRRINLGLSILNWREEDPFRAVELARLALLGVTLDELVALERLDTAPTSSPAQAA